MKQAPWARELEPDHAGPLGSAWRVEPPVTDDPRAEHMLHAWLVHAPGAHPFWAWHVVMGVALRDVEGLGPPHKQFPEAEYELLVLALDPNVELPSPQGMVVGGLAWMQPPDYVGQFPQLPGGDAAANEIVDLCARACTVGVLIPDSDHRASWDRSLNATVEHYLTGGVHGGPRPQG